MSALRERFGGTLGGDVSDKHRDRKVMAWSHHEKKTEWQVLEIACIVNGFDRLSSPAHFFGAFSGINGTG